MNIKIDYNGIDKSGKIAVVYARYSSHNQGEQSIEGQLAAAKAYAAGKGYTIIHEYIDRAMTGRNDNRDEFQQMLSDCAKKQFQVIIVWKVDRFGRNREEITFNKYRAKKHGVRVEYVAENIPDSAEAVILESVLEGMAEYYSLQLSQNIRRGYRENAKKCKYAGGRVPLGYKLAEDKSFEIDPKTAPIVKDIFTRYAAGQTITEIITALNAQGLRTSTGGEFTKNSLRALLKNEKYIGIFDFKNGEVRIEDGIPAIVDKSTFDKVQKMLVSNQRAPAHKWSKTEYLLTDKLFCGSCGGLMIGESGISKNGSKYSYYLCTNHKRKRGCDRKAIRADWLEKYVLGVAQSIILDDATIDFIADGTWEYYRQHERRQEKAEMLKGRLAEVDKALQNIMRAIEAGLPFTETTKARIEELDGQKTALTSALAETELSYDSGLTRDHILFFLKQFQKFDYSNPQYQKRLIDTFINSVYVYPDEMTFNFNFGGESKTIKFDEMEAARSSDVFVRCAPGSTRTRGAEHFIWFESVFALTVKMPER